MKNQKPIGQFTNYQFVEVKTTAGGTFTNEVENKQAPVAPYIIAKATTKPPETRTRFQNVEFLKKLVSKSDELSKLSGDEGLKINASDIEKLSDVQLNAIVDDLIKKSDAIFK